MPITNVRNKIPSDKFKLEDFLKSNASDLYKEFETYLEGLDLGALPEGVLPEASELDFNGMLSSVLSAIGLQLTELTEPLEEVYEATISAMSLAGIAPGKKTELIKYVESGCRPDPRRPNNSFGTVDNTDVMEGFIFGSVAKKLQCMGNESPITTLENRLGKEKISESQSAQMISTVLDNTNTKNSPAIIHDIAISNISNNIETHIPQIAEKSLALVNSNTSSGNKPKEVYNQLVSDLDTISSWDSLGSTPNLGKVKESPMITELAHNAIISDVGYPNVAPGVPLEGSPITRDMYLQLANPTVLVMD